MASHYLSHGPGLAHNTWLAASPHMTSFGVAAEASHQPQSLPRASNAKKGETGKTSPMKSHRCGSAVESTAEDEHSGVHTHTRLSLALNNVLDHWDQSVRSFAETISGSHPSHFDCIGRAMMPEHAPLAFRLGPTPQRQGMPTLSAPTTS